MRITIDNPGGGDCGFYALSIAMIDIIQREHQATKQSMSFNKWQALGFNSVSLDELLTIDLEALHKSPGHYKKPQLFVMQSSLRQMLVTNRIESLNRAIAEDSILDESQAVVSLEVFGKFMELVKAYKSQPVTLNEMAKFNELVSSEELRRLANATAESLTPKLVGINDHSERAKIEQAHVKAVFVNEVNKAESSAILKAVERVARQGVWATHCDLKELALSLELNLTVTGMNNGALREEWPVIKLNNHGNAHWTTEIESRALRHRVGRSSNQVALWHEMESALIKLQGLFKQNAQGRRIRLDKIDSAEAMKGESDEDFAMRLQDAECRVAGLYK